MSSPLTGPVAVPTPLGDAIAPPPPAPPPAGGIAGRILAAIVGVLLLAGGGMATLGGALVAPLGMAAAWAIARRRRRPLTRGAAWAGAVVVAVAAFAVVLGVSLWRAPAGSFAHARQAADSAAKVAAKQPPPPWLEKIAPGAAARQQQLDPATTRIVTSPAFLIWTTIMGGLLTCLVFGGFAGTVGWGGVALLLYAARGRWLPRRAAVAPPPVTTDL